LSSHTRYDTLYKKDIRTFRVEKGATKELRFTIPYGSSVTMRLSATYPVMVTMAGPHIEQLELSGTKEYKFTVDPGTELLVKFQGKTGFFSKPSDITVEIEMYTAKDAIRISEELLNLLDVLRELGKDYYDINKEHVQDVLKRLVNVWKLLDDETKAKAKELMTLAKKYESAG